MSGQEQIEQAFGVVVKHYRKARGWNQNDLAEKAGVHLATVVRAESGSGTVSAATLSTYGAAFGVLAEDIMAAVAREARLQRVASDARKQAEQGVNK